MDIIWRNGLTVCGLRVTLCLFLLWFSSPSRAEIGNPANTPPLLTVGGSLLEWVDLERPELEPTRDSLAEGHREKALRTLLQYFRTSERPRLSEKAPEPVLLADTAVADQVLRREITVGEVTQVLERWTQSDGRDVRWNWEMQRHSWWLDASRAYFNTRDEKYASFLNGMILDWYLSNRCPASDVVVFAKPEPTAWRTIDIGFRLANVWPEVFFDIRASSSLTDEALAAFLVSCHQQADHLVKYPKTSRWLLTESIGLLTTAVLYPEFRRAGEWLEIANSRLESLIGDEILPDGAHSGGSLDYLFPSLMAYAQAAYIQHINLTDPPPALQEALMQGLIYSVGIVEPSFDLPAVNDSDRLNLRDVLEEFGPTLPTVPELEYVKSNRSTGYPPDATSCYFPFIGHFVFRENWEPDALYALFDVGGVGNFYAHEDQLQFEIAAFGETLLGDMGRSTYKPGPARDYFMGTQSHNCILVDGRGMAFRSRPANTWVTRSPLECPNELHSDIQWAEAVYAGPWEDESLKIRWTRRFTFFLPTGIRSGGWVVSDRIEGQGTHRIDQLLDFFPGQASVDSEFSRVFFQRNAVQLVVQSPADQPARISVVKGQEQPFRGWFSPGIDFIEPAPSARISSQSGLPVHRDMVLMPYRIGEPCPLLSVGRDGSRLVCQTTAGSIEIPVPFSTASQ